MAKMSKPVAAFSSVLIGLLFFSCSGECYDNKNAIPRASFYISSPDGNASAGVAGIIIYGLGAPDAEPLYSGEQLSTAALPFRLDSEETTYVFQYTDDPDGPEDIVTFRYRPEPVFTSAACGAYYAFDDLRVEHTSLLIDSIVCPYSRITNKERDYIQIYFHPADVEEDEE